MGRQKSKDSGLREIDVSSIKIGDVTAAVYPAGVPTNEDGSIATEGDISVDQAKKVGAVSGDSARYNKDIAKKLAKKQAGEGHVRWNERDAIHLFDVVRAAFPPSSVFIYVQRVDPPQDYRPISMASVKNASEFYDYIARNIHKDGAATKYTVTFKDAVQQRGIGYINMPDMTNDTNTRTNEMPPSQFPPFAGAPPVGPYGYPYGYGQPQSPPYGYGPPPGYPYAQPPQPQPQQPQQPYFQPSPPQPQPSPAPPTQAAAVPVVAPALPMPPPRAEVLPLTATHEHGPQGQPYGQPYGVPQYIQTPLSSQQGSIDPVFMGALTSSYQELQRMQQLMHTNQLQLAQALGAIEEMKRNQSSHFQPQTQPQWSPPSTIPLQAPVPTTPPGVPPGPNPLPPGMPGYPPGPQQPNYPQIPGYPPQTPGYPPQPGYPQSLGYPQSPSYPSQSQPGYPQPSGYPGQTPNQNPLLELQRATSMLTGVARAVNDFKKVMVTTNDLENVGEEGEESSQMTQENPIEAPFKTMPLGFGENAPMLAYNPDGSVHWVGTMMGNAPKLVEFVQGITNAMAKAQQVQSNGQVQQQVTQQPPQQQTFQQPPQQQQQPSPPRPQVPFMSAPSFTPPAPPVRPMVGPQSLVPSMGALKSVIGG